MITSAGFIKKTQAEILSELEDAARIEFGNDVDLSVYGEVGQFVQLMSQSLADTWDAVEDAYYSVYIDTAEGVSLDRVVALGGIQRRPAQKAYGVISASGTNGTTISPGALFVQTGQGVQFINVASGVVASGVVSMTIQAIDGGEAGVVPAGSINELTNPFTGITDVYNDSATIGGAEIEADADLRSRYKEREVTSGSSVGAIISALKNLDGVSGASVVENDTDSIDDDGRPPYSIECIVGGLYDSSEVAEAIFAAKAAGIYTVGDIEYTVYDENNSPHVVRWNEPTEILVNVLVEVTSNVNWTTSNISTIRERVIEIVGGVYTDAFGNATQYQGGGIGSNVFSWKIESNFDDIVGIEDIICYVALAPATPSTTRKLVMASSEYARSDNDNVTVNVS